MRKRVFINHGLNAKPDSHWFQWLKKELEERGFEVLIPQMPNAHNPRKKEWVKTIASSIEIPDEQTYFVGHSLGCVSIVYYLQELPLDMKVGGCVFVGGFSNDIGKEDVNDFISEPVDFDKVKAQTAHFVTIVSRTDGSVPLDKAIDFQKSLGAELIVEQNMGHFTEKDGVVYLEVALQSILKIAS